MLDNSLLNELDIRIGTIISVNKFPEARNPSYKLKVNFGKYGILKSSAQITFCVRSVRIFAHVLSWNSRRPVKS